MGGSDQPSPLLPSLLGHTATSASFTYLCLLDFGNSYYGGGLLNHLSSDGFNCRSDGLFDPPRSFLHWRSCGLGPGRSSLRRLHFRSLGYLATAGSRSLSLLYF